MDLWYGFGVAFQWHNLMWSFFGVLVGNLIGVLPGSALSAILLPLTYVMPVPAILMLAGIFYGSHAGDRRDPAEPACTAARVTCLDGYPLTKQGKRAARRWASP